MSVYALHRFNFVQLNPASTASTDPRYNLYTIHFWINAKTRYNFCTVQSQIHSLNRSQILLYSSIPDPQPQQVPYTFSQFNPGSTASTDPRYNFCTVQFQIHSRNRSQILLYSSILDPHSQQIPDTFVQFNSRSTASTNPRYFLIVQSWIHASTDPRYFFTVQSQIHSLNRSQILLYSSILISYLFVSQIRL